MQTGLLFDFEDSQDFCDFMKLLEDSIKQSLGEVVFNSWFNTLKFKSFDGNILLLTVKNDKIKNCIFLHYQLHFTKILEKSYFKYFKKTLKKFEILVEDEVANIIPLHFPSSKAEFIERSKFNIQINLDKKFTFENFLQTEENRLSVGLAKHLLSSIISETENIIQLTRYAFISGGIGNGKTHIAQAIAHKVKEFGFEAIYTTAERFLFNFQSAVKKNELVEFFQSFIGLKLLIIDDIHFVATKKKTMEEIKKIATSITSEGGFVIFCSSGLPSDLPLETPELKSFVNSATLIKIQNPTQDFRFKILKFKSERSSYKISDSLLKLLSAKIQTNIRELEGSMGRMILHSQILNKDIELEASQFIATDIFPHKELKRFSITEIQSKVASHFGISFEDLNSKKRVKKVLRARQVAIYISSKLTTSSYIEIGKYFKKTHSTVIHSIKAVEKIFTEDRKFKEEVEILKISIEQQM